MTIEVDFFFGPASRYSYLASTQLWAIEAATGCRFHWRALFSGDLLAGRGYSPFRGQPVSGQYDWSYRQRDAEDWAAFYGVPFREPAAALKEETVPRRLALSCTAAARLGGGVAYASRLFHAVFAEALASFDDDQLGAFASDVGLGARGACRSPTGSDHRSGTASHDAGGPAARGVRRAHLLRWRANVLGQRPARCCSSTTLASLPNQGHSRLDPIRRIAHQILDGDDQPGGEDRGRTLDRQHADLRRGDGQVLGEAAKRRIRRQGGSDRLDESIERHLAGAVGCARQNASISTRWR